MSNSRIGNLTKVATYTGLLANIIALASAVYSLLSSFHIVEDPQFRYQRIPITGDLTVTFQSIIVLITTYGGIALIYAFRRTFVASARRANDAQSTMRTLRISSSTLPLVIGIPLFVFCVLFRLGTASQILAGAVVLVLLVAVLGIQWQWRPGSFDSVRFIDVGFRYFLAIPLTWFLIQLDTQLDWTQALFQSLAMTSAAYLLHLLIARVLKGYFSKVKRRIVSKVYINPAFGGLVAIVALVLLAIGAYAWVSNI